MKTSVLGISAATAVVLPVHVLLILSAWAAGPVLLIYIGIALPAVWSAKPARRKAAAAVLRLIRHGHDAFVICGGWEDYSRFRMGKNRSWRTIPAPPVRS